MRKLLPGLVLCLIAGAVSAAVNLALPEVSALLVAILLGVVVGNVVRLPESLRPGIAVSAKRVLRIGIVLLGLQVVVGDIVGLGWPMLIVIVTIVGLGLVGTLIAGRLLGMPWAQRVLIAGGFSICGAAAVAAASGVVDAEEEDVATGLGLVVLFGTLMIPAMPLLVSLLGMSDYDGGLWIGGATHEVAQVVAAAGLVGPDALKVAVIVKLARVAMLAPVIAVLSLLVRRASSGAVGTGKRPPIVPLFVVGFLAMSAVASLHLLPAGVLAGVKVVQTLLLAAAMFALGLGVRFATLAKVGPRPFVLGAISTVLVTAIAWAGVALTQ